MHEAVDPGRGFIVHACRSRPAMHGIDAGLAVDEEGAPWFGSHRRLGEAPRLSARDVVDQIRRQPRRRNDDDPIFVDDDEGSSVPGEQLGGSVKAGTVGVHYAAECDSRG